MMSLKGGQCAHHFRGSPIFLRPDTREIFVARHVWTRLANRPSLCLRIGGSVLEAESGRMKFRNHCVRAMCFLFSLSPIGFGVRHGEAHEEFLDKHVSGS